MVHILKTVDIVTNFGSVKNIKAKNYQCGVVL